MPDRLLAITGGAGRIATAIRPMLREHYQLRLADLRGATDIQPGEESVVADVSDLAAAERVTRGASAVLHLAADPSTSATWDVVRRVNLEATYNVYEAARRHGAHKVVFASSNHAMGFWNVEKRWPIPADGEIRPDSLYGVSKAFGEALGRYFSDAFGMSIICIRIGWFTPRTPNHPELNPLWISAQDLAQLFRLALLTDRRFGIYNGTSNNPQNHWDLTSARRELGYAPQDDVSVFPTDAQNPGPYVDPQAGVVRGATPR
jgi:NAD+ dependent glucose-6-phosphate dehydrogenase